MIFRFISVLIPKIIPHKQEKRRQRKAKLSFRSMLASALAAFPVPNSQNCVGLMNRGSSYSFFFSLSFLDCR